MNTIRQIQELDMPFSTVFTAQIVLLKLQKNMMIKSKKIILGITPALAQIVDVRRVPVFAQVSKSVSEREILGECKLY